MKNAIFVLATTGALGFAGMASAAFTDMDLDQDGYLSTEEFITAFPQVSEPTFLAADSDADGMISAEEHLAAIDAGLLPAE